MRTEFKLLYYKLFDLMIYGHGKFVFSFAFISWICIE